MDLEMRCAYWVNLGMTKYQDTYRLQRKIADLRENNLIPDVILSTEHYPEVSFGNSDEHNKFSDEFIQLVKNLNGGDCTEDKIKEALLERGIEFSISSRGGGATIFSPGQAVYYPIVRHSEITGRPLDLSIYKTRIYKIMFESLRDFGINGIKLGSDKSYSERNERKDIWINRHGKALKMGSKGIKVSKNVAYHGFALYIKKSGLEHFWMIKPCGYEPDEISATSVEEELGRQISKEKVDGIVAESIKRNFGYDNVIRISNEEFKHLLERKKEVLDAV